MQPAVLTALVSVAEPVETVVTMEDAAQNRLLDALAIAIERPSDALGCAYLLGYVVECTLKAALGRLLGVPPAADVWASVRRAVAGNNGHDLISLLTACLNQRRPPLATFSAYQAGVWMSRVSAVSLATAVAVRYKSYRVQVKDLEQVLRDVEWIVANAQDLWI